MIIINHSLNKEGTLIPDAGFNFGRGVFETILVKNRPVFLAQHCARLQAGLAKLNIQNPVDEKYILECLASFGIHDCVLKVIATEENTVLSTRQSRYQPEDYEKGFKLKLSTLKRNPDSHVTYLKSLNYTDNILEKELASREGFDEVLFLNTQGKLTEGSTSNLFFVRSGTIFTPQLSCGLLNGIIRDWVIENFDVREGEFTLDELEQADEVFLTNSVMGVMKVHSVAGVKTFQSTTFYSDVREKYENCLSGF